MTNPGLQGKVLCLHGYHTSSAVLQQQMLPLTAILEVTLTLAVAVAVAVA